MNKQVKFIKTAVAAAALGLVVSGAHAAAVQATSVKYAAELFGGTTPATAITGGNIQIVAASAIPANSTITVMLKLTNAKFATLPAAADAGTTAADTVVSPAVTTAAAGAGTLVTSVGSTNAGATAATAGIGAATATTNNADVLVIQLGTTDNAIGIGGTIATVYAPQLSAAALATVGTEVSATAYVFVGTVGAQFGQQPTGTNLEATSTATKIAESAKAVAMAVATATTAQKIDASANGSTKFTAGAASATDTGSATLVQLGKVTITETAGVKNAGGTADYTVATKAGASNTDTVVTVTGPAGYFAALGTTGRLFVQAHDANACAGAVLAQSALFGTGAAAAAATSIAIPLATIPAGANGAHLCMSVNGTTVIKDGAAAASAILGGTTAQAQDSSTSAASASLNALTLNGASVDVNSYWPAALNGSGYGTFTRITNTGSVGAAISVVYYNPNTGATVGSPVVIPLSGFTDNILPAGATVTLANSVIETAVGSAHPAGYKSGRIKLTAPTGSLRIQSFIQGTTGAPQETSGSVN